MSISVTTADTAPAIAAPPPPAAPGPLRWDGSAARLVVIGLGNLALSLATLGLYRFWGTVRFRRHLWAHQAFLGSRLEYAGTGGELFRGFLKALLVVAPLLLLVSLAETLIAHRSAVAWTFFAAKLAGLTYFVGMAGHAARRYVASRTAWRGLRFTLAGSPWRFGFVSLGWAALSLLSLGLAHPFAVAAQARWTNGRLRLGTEPLGFDGGPRGLLRPWLVLWGFVASSALALWLLLGAGASAELVALLSEHGVEGENAVALRLAVAALCALPAVLAGWCAWSAAAMRWRAAHTTLGGARFSMPGATGGAVFRLMAGNLLLSLLSLGLLHPVAMARSAAFSARHLRLDRSPDLSAARQAERGPRTGEGVADLLGAGAFG